MANQPITVSKTALAKRLGVSRSSLYYRHKQPAIDLETKLQIEAVMTDNPAYGHKRIALEQIHQPDRITLSGCSQLCLGFRFYLP